MKKLGCILAVMAVMVACKDVPTWSESQKDSVKALVDQHKSHYMLDWVDEDEMDKIESCVLKTVMDIFPEYVEFYELTDKDDTVMSLLGDCAEEKLGDDYRHLEKYFAYEKLRAKGIISVDLNASQQKAYYDCLKGKVKGYYPDASAFILSIHHDKNAPDNVRRMLQTCAMEVIGQ